MDLEIDGITVIFPHKPYDIQVNYMRSVIQALQNKQNALLESPTGTGKTLSLLCSSLAWLDFKKYQSLDQMTVEDAKSEKPIMLDELPIASETSNSVSKKGGKGKAWKKENPIRIIYSSRTHSQLSQACGELKNSYYQFSSTVTIGSREQLCINQDVTKLETSSAKNQACRLKVKNSQCLYHHNYESKISDLSFSGSHVYDIEDLIRFGNENKACPYYLAKAKSDFNTSLVFMPYNYVLDPMIRKTLKLNLENCVIIFDEGHNIERVCEDSMSTELKSESLALFIKTFDSILQSLNQIKEGTYEGINEKDLLDLDIHTIAKVKWAACDLEKELDSLVKSPKGNASKGSHDTEEILRILNRSNIDRSKFETIADTCEKIITFVVNSNSSFMVNQMIASLTSVCSFIETILMYGVVKKGDDSQTAKQEFIKNYKLFTERHIKSNNNEYWSKTQPENLWTVYLWCMSPSVAIKSLQREGIFNLIITSGTLSPLESFECEMGIPFQVKLQNSHVISSNQLSIQMILKDPNGNELCGSFENRNNQNYYNGLGLAILELAQAIPKGVFIFFSSYSLINRCIELWKGKPNINLWNAISSRKRIFVEPRSKNEFNESIQLFKETIDMSDDGAIFMAVSRGKLSEGIDLGDDYCRAVIVIGLPYPARYDPKVTLKQQYLNENKCKMNGNQWYMLQMKRALNQSIGRVVRHKNDYGLILLCDSRFKQLQDGFSNWIVPFLDRKNLNNDLSKKLSYIKSFYNSDNRNQAISSKKESNRFSHSSNVQSPMMLARKTKSVNPPFKSPLIRKKANQEDDNEVIEEMFDSILKNYKNLENFNEKKPTNCSNSKSIFDQMNSNDSLGSFKRKPSKQIISQDAVVKIEQTNKKLKNDKEESQAKKRISKYFKSIQLDFDDNDQQQDGILKEQNLPEKIEKFIMNEQEFDKLKRDIFKTEQNSKTFKEILDSIICQPSKCRQLLETLNVYSRKHNATYLALRLKFILNEINDEKRRSLLRNFSLVVPELQRKHFLKTCLVD